MCAWRGFKRCNARWERSFYLYCDDLGVIGWDMRLLWEWPMLIYISGYGFWVLKKYKWFPSRLLTLALLTSSLSSFHLHTDIYIRLLEGIFNVSVTLGTLFLHGLEPVFAWFLFIVNMLCCSYAIVFKKFLGSMGQLVGFLKRWKVR